jgi:sulfate adenylyltransferase
VHLTTVDTTPEECARRIIALLEERGFLTRPDQDGVPGATG